MNELTIVFMAVAMAFFLFNQLAILGQIRSLQNLFRQIKPQLGSSNTSSHVTTGGGSPPTLPHRRIKFRAKTEMPGNLQIGTQNHSVTVEDVSPTGVMIRCEDKSTLKLNYEYPFSMVLPGNEKITASLKIIRIVDFDARRYGACFVNLPIGEKRAITQYVNQSAEKELQEGIS